MDTVSMNDGPLYPPDDDDKAVERVILRYQALLEAARRAEARGRPDDPLTDRQQTERLANISTARTLEQNLRNCGREDDADAVRYLLEAQQVLRISPGGCLVLRCPPGMPIRERESWQAHVSIVTGQRVVALAHGLSLSGGHA